MLALLAMRHQVALLCLRAADEPPVDDVLKARCQVVEEITRPAFRSVWARRARLVVDLLQGRPQWVSDWAVDAYHYRVRSLVEIWKPEIVQIEFSVMAQYLGALNACPAPRILTEYDPGPQAAHDQLELQRGIARVFQYLDLIAWKRFERAVIKHVQTVVAFTDRDRHLLAQFASQTPIIQIPISTVLPEKPLDPVGDQFLNLLFVGSFIHPPNEDAAMRLINTIFPGVQTQYSDVILNIVGDQPTAQIQKLANSRVIVTGRVPDVTPYLDRATLVVVPLRSGGGMRVKVMEALAAGKAIVASPLAIEGLDVVDGEHVVLAESDQQFATMITQLLVDPARRETLAANARAWACANLGWEKVITAYEKLYQSLITSSSEARLHQEAVL